MFVMNVFEELTFTFASNEQLGLSDAQLFAHYCRLRQIEADEEMRLDDLLTAHGREFSADPDSILLTYIRAHTVVSDKLQVDAGISRNALLREIKRRGLLETDRFKDFNQSLIHQAETRYDLIPDFLQIEMTREMRDLHFDSPLSGDQFI